MFSIASGFLVAARFSAPSSQAEFSFCVISSFNSVTDMPSASRVFCSSAASPSKISFASSSKLAAISSISARVASSSPFQVSRFISTICETCPKVGRIT